MKRASRQLGVIIMILTTVFAVQTISAETPEKSKGKSLSKNDQNISPGKIKTNDRLPLDRGWFLPEEIKSTCEQILEGPSADREGILLSYDGVSLNNSAHEECNISNVIIKGNVYDVTLKCESEGKMGKNKSIDHKSLTIKNKKLFTIKENGKLHVYTWRCGLPK